MHHRMEWELCWLTVRTRVLSVQLLLRQEVLRQLSATSHLDKEALALVFGVTKFRQYVGGREFEAVTDHKTSLGADSRFLVFCKPLLLLLRFLSRTHGH